MNCCHGESALSYPSRCRAPRKAAHQLQYQLRIELNEVQPPVWRRLLVPENVTLVKLNLIPAASYGWQGGHLHEYMSAVFTTGSPMMTGRVQSPSRMSVGCA